MRCGAASGAQPLVAELIVALALIVVGENLISLGGFFELGLGLGIVRVAIRVILERKTPIRAFDLVGVGGALDGEDFVIVSGSWHESSPRAFPLGAQGIVGGRSPPWGRSPGLVEAGGRSG